MNDSDRLLMEALEIVPKGAPADELFQAWGEIIRDFEIFRLSGDFSRIRRTGEPPDLRVEFIPEKTVGEVVVAMSLEERRALRDRVRANL